MSFRDVKKTKIGGKFLVYGFSGTGKSFFGCTFPKIAAIDSETGLGFYEGEDLEIAGKTYNNLVSVDTTANLDDLEEDLDAINEGEMEGIETLLIDSETKMYNTMDIACSEVVEKKAKLSGKNVDTRTKWEMVKNINTKLQQAKISASAQGFHVVSTAQAKDIMGGKDNQEVIGHTYDAHKSLKFDYDIVLYFYTERDKITKELKHMAIVEKDRTRTFNEGEILENPTYDLWKPYFDKRNGLEVNGANFTKDLKSSITTVLTDSEKSEKLAKELKSMILKNKDNKEFSSKAKELFKEEDISPARLSEATPEQLKKIKNELDKLL